MSLAEKTGSTFDVFQLLDDYLPLYEAKMFHQFDHLFGTYEGQTEAQAAMSKLPEATLEQHSNLKQLPILPSLRYNDRSPDGAAWSTWISPRVVQLQCTDTDVAPFGRDCGFDNAPYQWDENRCFQIRCELDAAFFHLYGLDRDNAAYILDAFPVTRKKDEKARGYYRTKDTILNIYDQLQHSIATHAPQKSLLEPPPGDPRAADFKESVPS